MPETQNTPTRPVWLTREEVAWVCRRIADLSITQTIEREIGDDIIAKVRTAPADAVEAIQRANNPEWTDETPITQEDLNVLRALGGFPLETA